MVSKVNRLQFIDINEHHIKIHDAFGVFEDSFVDKNMGIFLSKICQDYHELNLNNNVNDTDVIKLKNIIELVKQEKGTDTLSDDLLIKCIEVIL